MKTRILHIIGSMNAGGMETMIMNYYRHLDRERFQYDFLVFTPGEAFYEKEIKKLGGKIYKVVARRKNPFKNHGELKKFFEEHQYDIVQIHQGVTTLLPLKLAHRYQVRKIIVHNHGIDLKQKKYLSFYINHIVKKKIVKWGTDFFACSRNVLSDLFDDRILKDKKYFICTNAIETQKFEFSLKWRERLRKEFQCEDKIIYGHVGTFTYPKNHKFLIEVFESMYHKNSNIVLWLVGTGKLKSEIEEIVKSKGLEKAVFFLGQRTDVNHLMSAMDVLLFPSLFEGFPLTLVEAQINGLPIVASSQITSEIKLTENIYFCDFNKDQWTTIACKIVKDRKRKFNINEWTTYDINCSVKKLMDRYER